MSPTEKRRERERHRHRREILRAAVDLFSENGFERTTMADVAVRAEFAVGTLYKYFKNKQDLYEALIEDLFTEASDVIKEVLCGPGDEIERVEKMVEATTHLIFEHQHMVMIFFAESLGGYFAPVVGLRNDLRQLAEECAELLEDVFASGIDKGLFVPLPPHILVAAFHGMSNGIHNVALGNFRDNTEEKIVEFRKRIFLDAVCIRRTD